MKDDTLWLLGCQQGGEPGQAFVDDSKGQTLVFQPHPPVTKPVAANDNNVPVINPADWHGKPIPSREWFIPNMVPMRQVTILSGDGGVGKSLLALQIAAAGAMSINTLGMEPQAGNTLYIGAEDEAEEFQRRLSDIAKSHGSDFAALPAMRLVSLADRDALLSIADRSGNMQPTSLWLGIEKYIRDDWQPRLVVLDTVADLFGGDEIKRGQVRQFIGMLRKLAIECDCAVVLLAHPSVQGMQSGTGSSGSTAWNNSVRSRLYLTKDKDNDEIRILTTMKANYGKAGGEVRLRWQDGAFVLDDGKPSAAAGLLNKRADKVFLECLSEINRTGRRVSSSRSVTYAPSVIAGMPGATSLSKKTLEESMKRLFADEKIRVISEGPPSKSRERLVVVADEIEASRMASD
ncbi:AAA family ATPase [Aureimonas altamirensis]|uniref:AAA family ATPase n=1 Tax=Aureimonas altamirensis TaxID=370622 RepID=UPI0018CFA106|nr:AAA family ATPase [Aureimonas altamirensis]